MRLRAFGFAAAAIVGLGGCEQILDWMYDDYGPNDGLACNRHYDPVCGSDGNTYANWCDADLHGVDIAYGGECEAGPCGCDDVWDPVCDRRGNTYSNRCEARCQGAGHVVRCDGNSGGDPGPIPPSPGGDCACPEYYSPVCTPDGQQYDNRCFAACAGEEHFAPCGDSRR